MDDEELAGTEQFVANDQGADRIVAGASSSVADDMRISFCQSGELCWVKARVHTSKHGETAGGWEREIGLASKCCAVLLICLENFVKDFAHDLPPYSAASVLTTWMGKSQWFVVSSQRRFSSRVNAS